MVSRHRVAITVAPTAVVLDGVPCAADVCVAEPHPTVNAAKRIAEAVAVRTDVLPELPTPA
jgi:hypothetical protein